MLKLTVAGRSDVGRSRRKNEDAFVTSEIGEWTVLCVADGLGGHERGQWASGRALEVFVGEVESRVASASPESVLREACAAANAAVCAEGGPAGRPLHPATTLVAAFVRGSECWWLNVGDSRLYVHSATGLRQVSEDHSWVAEQVRAGMLPASALRSHANRNVVSRTIGFEAEIEPDIRELALLPGDTLLLCSDGLFGPVDDEQIEETLAGLGPEAAAAHLIGLANAAGGPDNITVVLARLDV